MRSCMAARKMVLPPRERRLRVVIRVGAADERVGRRMSIGQWNVLHCCGMIRLGIRGHDEEDKESVVVR